MTTALNSDFRDAPIVSASSLTKSAIPALAGRILSGFGHNTDLRRPSPPLNTNQETNHVTEHFDAADPQS